MTTGHGHAPGDDRNAHEHKNAHTTAPSAGEQGTTSHSDVERHASFGPPKKRVAIGGGIEIATIDDGNGPVIMFVHGIPASGVLWRKVVAELAPAYRCLAPDMLGFGDSRGPLEADVSLEAQARYAVSLLDALRIASATVIGHSVGGGVAQVMAVKYAERVQRLVLTGTIAYDNWPAAALKPATFVAKWPFLFDIVVESGLLARYARSRFGMRSGVYRPDAIDDTVIAEYLRPLYADGAPGQREGRERMRRFLVAIEASAPALTLDLVDALRHLKTPTLVVWAKEDKLFGVSWAKRLAAEIPGCSRLELIPFAGHYLPEEKPAEFAIVLREFMQTPPSPLARPNAENTNCRSRAQPEPCDPGVTRGVSNGSRLDACSPPSLDDRLRR